MTTTSENRTRFNNQWPAKYLFPVEQDLTLRLAKNNFRSIFFPATLIHSDDHHFQTLLAHSIDSLDSLPLRPDLAFDQLWKALDAEFFRLKSLLGVAASISRFKVFSDYVSTSLLTSKSHYSLVSQIPLQTCEFLAKRLLDSTVRPNQHSHSFIAKLTDAVGKSLLSDLHTKYDPVWATVGSEAAAQRNLGKLLKFLLVNKPVKICGNDYLLTPAQSAQVMIGTILPQFRNERFHGNVRPPFRSSAASLKTYAHSYFLLIYSYSLLLEVFLYQNFGEYDSLLDNPWRPT
jgi:hypothetical protein